ncbi:lycopene cyclase family protein [Pseudonocardia oroxyli]|uniref:Lycopene cyclase (CrtL-type) n=1 Tax=Pseudonocardia oroxyli TaxID=366584 RepID=A0A1G7HVU1_PSEOR|nr:lycopene cyclase family protein [Pseudonocardia oroxyli]SDF04468.1 lycopene cyclase (CrtL-type) [Pseudonocardia oroxyli]
MLDVLVAGGGPAGRALAGACAKVGLRTALADPAPERPWRSTFAAWSGELPPLPDSAIASRSRGRAVAGREHALGWDYTVLDTAGLRAALDEGLAGVALHRARLGEVEARLGARIVIDATGHRPTTRRVAAEQTAYGVVVDEDLAAPFVARGEALFMDWRPDHGRPGWPTFLYAVPLGGGAVLLEETSLARRPGLPLPELRERLHARLAHHGIAAPADARTERVRFPVDGPLSPSPRRLVGPARPSEPAFGAATPLVHPATGFSVATALTLAPRLAEALTRPDAVAAARRVLWPAPALAVHALRRRGLESLLRMPPAQVPAFFDVFFGLPERHRWAYLTARADLPGTLAAMGALYRHASWPLRARLVGPALGVAAHPTG